MPKKKPSYRTFKTLRGVETYRDKMRKMHPDKSFGIEILDFNLWCVTLVDKRTRKVLARCA